MANGGQNNGNGSRWIHVAIAVIGAALGGGGSTRYVVSGGLGNPTLQEIARPDPFTGSQGRRIEERLDALERRVDQLPPREIEIAIERLRSDIEYLDKRLEQLERR